MNLTNKALCGLLAGVLGISFGVGVNKVNVTGEDDYLAGAANAIYEEFGTEAIYIAEKSVVEEVDFYYDSVLYQTLVDDEYFFVLEGNTDVSVVTENKSEFLQISDMASFLENKEGSIVLLCDSDEIDCPEELFRWIEYIIIIPPEPPFDPIYREPIYLMGNCFVYDGIKSLDSYLDYFN